MVLRELLVKLGLNVNEAEFAKGELAAKVLEKSFEKIVDVGKELVHEFFEKVDAVSEYAIKVKELSQQVGLTTTEMQQLGKAAASEGIGMEDFSHSLVLLARTMNNAKSGSEEAGKSFSKIGVKIKNADGSLRSTGDVLEDIAEAMSKMPDGAEKTALSLQLLGRSGASMIPLLNKGAEELEKFRKASVMSPEEIEAGEQVVKIQRQLAAQTKSLWREAVAPLLPAIRDLLKKWLEWKKANAEVLKQKIREWVGYVVKAVEVLADVFAFLVKNAAAVKAIIVTGLIVALGQLEVAAVGAAIKTGLAWLAAAAPFIALGALITAILLLFDDFRQYEKDQANHSKRQHSAYGKFLEGIKEMYKDRPKPPFLQHFLDFIEAIRDFGSWWKGFKKDVSDLQDWLADVFQKLAAIANLWGGGMFGGKAGEKMSARGQALLDDLAKRSAPAVSQGNKKFKGFSSPRLSSRAPQAPAAASYEPTAPFSEQPGSNVTVQQKTQLYITQQPGESSEDLSDRIMTKLEDRDEAAREAANDALKGDRP